VERWSIQHSCGCRSREYESIMHEPLLTTDYLDRAVELYGNNVGVIADDGTEFTYAELGERINRLSNALREWGVEKGDRVALLSPNSHYYIETLYATMQLGALFVPLNSRLQPEEYEHLLDASPPEIVIADYEYGVKLQPLREEATVEQRIADDADHLSDWWNDYDTVLSKYPPDQPGRPDMSD